MSDADDAGRPGDRPNDDSTPHRERTQDRRLSTDACTKVGACDAECPVAAVDDDFPGPKFQGPEQGRLNADEDAIDDSITDCSNCLRCDDACPSDVPFAALHNQTRAEYVREQQPLSIEKVRNRILANYRTSARLASWFPRTANLVMGNRAVRWAMEKTLKIPSEREFPDFATQTFRDWWKKRGGEATSKRRAREARGGQAESSDGDAKRVAYFHGCYSNFNTTGVAKAMVRVYESLGYEVTVPRQKCSGTPMFANGRLDDARRHARVNVDSLGQAIDAGYDIVCTCTSCSLALREEYPNLFDLDGVDRVAAHTYDALEYLRIHEDLAAEIEGSLDGERLAYHAPCHSRNQGLDRQVEEVFDAVEGIEVVDVGDSCSGISGTYGWKAEHYETSMDVGREMFEHIEAANPDRGMTECPTCAMQMAHGTDHEVVHPFEMLERVLV
ncbi:anaerobic glycerol-3-phosphate dehydrogenase subunit C [Halococcoides cellulosivorans]|uniref:Anaerobic glycerol-3-phosphate dehydrogenase subunit C n=1 Tax=Halococcoides cellulosivorans TaxID=1679096 RepID=A0A2R4WZF1_9EURY|nr:anaerobic glycerol-3-phosphate dehydrogenase subunit C [Halococcoides cellulosivorans]AWB26922.1 anaerobic glycerol-3-phosphate dehydrogenase subunit C [Halococcoides cellulosivorans]